MTSVLLLNRYDRLGASSRLRFLDFLPALKAHGITVTPSPLFNDSYLRDLYAGRRQNPFRLANAYSQRIARMLDAGRFDLVWLEKEALPWLPAGIERALFRRIPYVMDLDDAWFHRYGLHRAAPVRALLGRKLEALAQGAQTVVAGNPHLADWARAAGARSVVEIPTVINLDRYPPPVARPVPSGRPFTIGWMGSPSSAPYLAQVAEALAELAGRSESDAVQLLLVGAHGAEPTGLNRRISIVHEPWSEGLETALLGRFDVGIMPLVDGPWERGKCGYKLIQYMAAGIPVVASPVGINTTLVRDGENGFLASEPEQWATALARLASDPLLRARMGAAGRRLVEERFNLQAVAPRLAEALETVAHACRHKRI